AGLPAASRTWITGCWANAAPLAAVGEGSVVIVSCVAVPAPSVIVEDVAGVRPGEANLRVQATAPPLMPRPLKIPPPLPTVLAVALLNVAPAAPESTPSLPGALPTPAGLPAASRTWITGCWANAAPLAAVGEGSVVIVSCVAVPAPSVIVEDVAGV